jgi:DNA sulfur modification protein DndB
MMKGVIVMPTLNVVTVYNQFGKRYFGTQLDFTFLQSIYEIDGEISQQIDKERVIYEKDGLLAHLEKKTAILLPPFILSARGKVIIKEDAWELPAENKLFVLHGQEKLLGFEAAVQYLKNKKEWAERESKFRVVKQLEKMIERLTMQPICLQIYLELSLEEERKFYSDINNERRGINPSLKIQYDQRNEFTILTRKVAKKMEYSMEIDQKVARIRDQSSALTSLSIMYKCTLAMWEGNLVGKEPEPKNLLFSLPMQEAQTERFYKVLLEVFPVHAYNRQKYVSGLAGIQIALAYTVFLLTKEYSLSYERAIQKLLALKVCCTWQHDDPLFTHLFNHTTGRIQNHHTKGAIQETARRFIANIT